jgi:large subunit ribosomal protein L14e
MMEIGRVCVKIAGRDAGTRCVIVKVLDDTYVMIDGEARARKCNIKHLEPTATILEISEGAGHASVISAFRKAGIEPKEWKKAENKGAKTPKPKPTRKAKLAEQKAPNATKAEKPKAAKPAKK